VLLVDATRRFSEISVARGAAIWLVVVAVVVSLVPYGAAVAALVDRELGAREAFARATTRLPRVLLWTGLGWFAVAGLAAFGAFAVTSAAQRFETGSVLRVQASVVLALLAAVPVAALSIAIDAARAHALMRADRVLGDLAVAWRVVRRRGLRLLAMYAAITVLGVGVAAGAAVVGLAAFRGEPASAVVIAVQLLAAAVLFAMRVVFVRSVALHVRAMAGEGEADAGGASASVDGADGPPGAAPGGGEAGRSLDRALETEEVLRPSGAVE
jgi:hypothetical protein